jgi:hypothetical protein
MDKDILDIIGSHDQERLRAALIDQGLIEHPLFLPACKVKILILVDQGISFNHYAFGLGEVLDTLRTNPEYWVKFEITRAHRQTDLYQPAAGTVAASHYAPHHQGFRFDTPPQGFDLSTYHQVWFFGFNSTEGALTDGELDILFAWMDKGGGVFATGDHATLGEALCSRIPRVRSMRKWTAGQSVPPAGGPTRHDTLLKGHDYDNTADGIQEGDRYTFDDESDDVPMRIRPRWYTSYSLPWLRKVRRPHPILCGRDGVIDVLPDHPHEGQVVVPTDLDETMQFNGGHAAREYPDLNGAPLRPEIIAWARVQADHGNHPQDFKGPANAKQFGAIGAYDGHKVNVGRVVTDSTWHHWFNINLTGRSSGLASNDARKLSGFNDTPQGRAVLARIRNYFRNVAIWLSPPKKIQCMATRAYWGTLIRYPLVEEVVGHRTLWNLGRSGLDVIGRRASQCATSYWWPYLIPELKLERLPLELPLFERLEPFLVGGVIDALHKQRERRAPDDHPKDEELLTWVREGALAGLRELEASFREQRELEDRTLESLAKGRKGLEVELDRKHGKDEC